MLRSCMKKSVYFIVALIGPAMVSACLGMATPSPIAATPTSTLTSAVTPPQQPAVGSSAAPDPSAVTAVPSGQNKMGIHMLLDDGTRPWSPDVWPSHMQYARQAAGEWGYVVQLVTSSNLKVKYWQVFMDLCAQYHLTPIIRLATTFNISANFWEAPQRGPDGGYKGIAAQYASFLTRLNWPTNVHYVVVGNEPNHGNEWGNNPNPAEYARFLIDVADALHAADPSVKVMNAGFDSYAPNTNGLPAGNGVIYIDEESFIDGMIAAQPHVFSHIDLWNSHPYPRGPFISGPWDQVYGVDLTNGATNPHHVDPPPGIPNRGINGYEWELFKLSTYGIPSLPVMVTETGWRHAESNNQDSLDDMPNLARAASLARYFRYALVGNDDPTSTDPHDGWTPLLKDPRVVGASIFALDGYEEAWGHTNLLIMSRDGQVKATYPIFDELVKISEGQ